MKAYELLCIVSGKLDAPPNAQTRIYCTADYTAVMAKKPRPALSLPLSRADALKDAAYRQKLFEALLPKGTVLVAKPRQWITLAQAVGCLTTNAAILAKLCAQLRDQVQFQITVEWEPSQVLSHFRTAPELAGLFHAQTASARQLEAALGRLRQRLATQISDLIAPVATDMLALPRAGEMLSNLAVLIPNEREIDLDLAVERVDEIWTDGLTIRQIGPSAAGSFALLDLEWISAKDIEHAHQILGIKRTAKPDAQAAARRRVLLQPNVDAIQVKRAAAIAASASD
ncbi:unnamed protein product, partial [Ectocarpus sp. 12 AP-2014]